MSHRHARIAVPALLTAVLTAGCLAQQAPLAPVHAGTATVKVRAGFAPAAGRRVTTAPAPKWTPAEVEYVRFDVYVVGGGATPYLTQFVAGADIRNDGTILTFTSLAANTTYRIEARAYDDALGMQDDDFDGKPDGLGAATKISLDQTPATAWQSTVAVATDNEPTFATPIALQLIDRVFDGVATLPAPDTQIANGECTFDPQGVVSTIVGGGSGGAAFVHGGVGLSSAVFDAGQMVYASDGTLYVAAAHQVFMVTRDRKTYLLGGFGTPNNGVGFKGNLGLDTPHSVALSADETELYVADYYNGRIIGIDLESDDLFAPMPVNPDTTGFTDPNYARIIAGAGTGGDANDDGNRLQAKLDGPAGLALAADGSLLVTNHLGNTVRRIDLNSPNPDADPLFVTTIAGARAVSASTDAAADARNGRFKAPYDIERYQDGFLITDQDTPKLRKLTPLAGGGWGLTTFAAAGDFAADASGDELLEPQQLAVDHAGRIWFSDRDKIGVPPKLFLRCLDPSKAGDARLRSWIKRTEAQFVPYVDGHVDDGSFAWAGATAFRPVGVAVDPSGTVFFSDPTANSVRKLQ